MKADKSHAPVAPILVVDDEEQSIRGVEMTLRAAGFAAVVACTDARQVAAMMARQEPLAVILDLRMPHVRGEDILARIVRDYPDVPVVIMTGVNDVQTAVMCLKMGAFDYLMKPLASDRVVTTMRKAMEVRDLRRENELLKGHILSGRLANPEAFSAFNTRNEVMLALFRYVESVAASPAPVLVTGETGVGKELAAQAIHRVSGRAGGYVSVNVAGLDEATFSDTLFGHKRGAFTGASEARGGLIEKAAGGTLFLDEIGDLTPALQTKLLRLLQEAEYLPLGADVAKRSDARIIVATNKPLNQLRDPAQFRPDLFFRLRHHHIHLPPLRERKGDLPMLVRQLVGQAAANMRMKAPAVPETVIRHLGTYDFPGNVRELAAMIQDAVAQSGGNALSVEVFQKWIGTGIAGKALPAGEPAGETEAGVVEFPEALPTLKAMSATLIAEAMRRADGNQAVAAKMLGISRQALNQRLSL